MKERASADGRSKIADRLQPKSSNNPLPDSRLPTTDHRLPASGLRLLSSALQLSTSRFPPTASPSPISHLPSSRKRGHAFSLVELLAVVGIIAILSVAAVPVMRGLGGSQSSRATASILVSALEQARTAAILSGTDAYIVFPAGNFPNTNYLLRSYAIIRPKVTNNGVAQDDFLTNQTAAWILLSKWERLPGDLLFSANRLSFLTNLSVTNLTVPGSTDWTGNLRGIGFTPSGGLSDGTGTNGLLFASSAKVTNGMAAVADRIDISLYSGRVRYTGIVTNTNF